MKQRCVYLDYLRVMATLAVIVVHVASQGWYAFGVDSVQWNALNACNGIMRWCVPIFVMISGSLFLSRETDTKVLYHKYILKTAVAYVCWALFYAIAFPVAERLLTGEGDVTVASILAGWTGNGYHLWFLPMIIGLYMCVPILKQLVQNDRVTTYFLWLSFVFGVAAPFAVAICRDFIAGATLSVVDTMYSVVEKDMGMQLVLGFPFYFVLGYRLDQLSLTCRRRRVIYAMGVLGAVMTVVLNAALSHLTAEPSQTYFSNFHLNVLFMAVAVHTCLKYCTYANEKFNVAMARLGSYSFGAYLVHVLVIRMLVTVYFDAVRFSPFVYVPLVTVLATVLSFAASWVLHRIPVLNKWIV